MRNAALVAAVLLAAAVLVVSGDDEPRTGTSSGTTVPDRVETVESLDPVTVFEPRGLDDVLVVTQPLGEDGGTVITIDLAAGTFEARYASGAEWPADLVSATEDLDHPDAEAAARSPDGTKVAEFTRSQANRSSTGISIWTRGRVAREFHHLSSVGDLVSRRIVWSPEGDAVYFLAANEEGSADRIVAIPLGRGAQTVVSFRERGFYGIGVQPSTE